MSLLEEVRQLLHKLTSDEDYQTDLYVSVEVHIVLLDDTPSLDPVTRHKSSLVSLLVQPALTVPFTKVFTTHSTICEQ
jgi:hypothetical protein